MHPLKDQSLDSGDVLLPQLTVDWRRGMQAKWQPVYIAFHAVVALKRYNFAHLVGGGDVVRKL